MALKLHIKKRIFQLIYYDFQQSDIDNIKILLDGPVVLYYILVRLDPYYYGCILVDDSYQADQLICRICEIRSQITLQLSATSAWMLRERFMADYYTEIFEKSMGKDILDRFLWIMTDIKRIPTMDDVRCSPVYPEYQYLNCQDRTIRYNLEDYQ